MLRQTNLRGICKCLRGMTVWFHAASLPQIHVSTEQRWGYFDRRSTVWTNCVAVIYFEEIPDGIVPQKFSQLCIIAMKNELEVECHRVTY